jgi:hypothetical protein
MAKKNKDKMKEMENVKYEVAQEMGLPQTKKKKERKKGKKT